MGYLDLPEPSPREPAWIERLWDPAGYRERKAAYEDYMASVPYFYNPEIAWYDEIGSLAYMASEWGLPGAPEVPEDVVAWRRERRWA